MSLLLPLALIALLLLVDPPRMPMREHLEPTSLIRPDSNREEAEEVRRGTMVPEPMKTEFASERPGLPKDRAAGISAGEYILDPAFREWYYPATSPLTEASLDAYVASLKTKWETSQARAKNDMLRWIANGNVRSLLKAYFIDQQASTPSPAPTPTPTRTLSSLKAEYDTKSALYKDLIDAAVRSGNTGSIGQIRQLNLELAGLLEQMMSTVSPTQPTKSIEGLRAELVGRLRRIQQDYNGLLQTTDDLETLRRIRAQEDGGFVSVLYWHLIALAVVFVGVLGVMLYMRRQSTPATTASPTMSADLE